jgi:hypothetical protein
LRSGESALPLPPQQRAQLVPDPAIELFQHSTFFPEPEVCHPTTNYRVELVDNLFQAVPTRAAQRLTDLVRETLATGRRDFQLRFLVPCALPGAPNKKGTAAAVPGEIFEENYSFFSSPPAGADSFSS